ncbi:E3 ubiquitin-protein ligase RBBP6-like [Brachionichthys hirsutus]|uniref:E3 ubiquitin-protein ligase RBBP6-like n=1 Tax=Brachionichthys hirsutus TaxID=412623 RepID=UPI0036043A86
MAHIHYKFSSKLSSDTAVFADPRITLLELKRQIMRREKLRAADCDLQITNAQTKEEYTDDEGLIPKGSSVIVRRIPVIAVKSSWNSKTRNVERSNKPLHHAFGAIRAMANLAEVDASEEEKINMVVAQASINQPKIFDAALPANYTCYRCGDTGHHIRNCPTSGARTGHDKSVEAPLRLKKSTGIPRSFMVEVDGPNVKGAMLTNCGHYAIPAMHAKAYAIGKKERPPFLPKEPSQPVDEEEPVPEELLCLLCRDLLSDAVVIPCCGGSYCDDCIRTALLDSEEHVCPTCKKSNVSPDTLVANKFLRQAVNTFENEQGQAKSLQGQCGSSQSPNPPPTPVATQSLPRKFHQSEHILQAADTPPSPQACVAAHTATGPAPASIDPGTSLRIVQEPLEIPHKQAVKKTHDDSALAALPVLVSNKEPSAAVSQLTPPVRTQVQVDSAVEDLSQSAAVSPQRSSTGQVLGQPSTCWESSLSLSSCSTEAWSKSNIQLCPPFPSVSSYLAPPPPLFLPPHFHTFLSAQQPLNRFAPGYQPVAPLWTLQPPQGAPIPSVCSSTSTHLTKEWCMRQGKRNERSPLRTQTYKRSSSPLNSKSKSRSSRSYSRSSSRSRSRSCSKGRSRPHSPDSGHRDLHSRSRSSHSYGYKRSPTPSSSSSPRVGHNSRSKTSPGRRKSSHHSRHHGKKSTSGKHSARRRGESSRASSPSYPDARHAKKTSSPKTDRQQYKQEYKDWCEKYYKSYVGHLNQPPSPLPFPQWLEREESRNRSNTNLESRKHFQGKGIDSPPSRSSSDRRSLPSRPSNERLPMPSQSSGDIGHAAAEHKDHLRTRRRRCAEKQSQSRKDDEQQLALDFTNLRTLKCDQNRGKKCEKDIEKESSAGGIRKDKRTNSTGAQHTQDAAAATEVFELTQLISKPDKHSGKDSEIYVGEERNLEIEKGWRRGKYSDSSQYEERRHKDKSSKRAGRVEVCGYRNTAGSKAFDSESENRKRKAEDVERSSVEAESDTFLKTDCAEVPKIHTSDSLNPFQTKKSKIEKQKESKRGPLSVRDIWDGEVKVKPQKKINININMHGKMKDESTEKACSSGEGITGKPKEEIKTRSSGEEENEGEALVWKKATFRDDVGQTEEGEEGKDSASQSRVLRTAEEPKEGSKEQEEYDGMGATDERSSTKGGQEEGRRVRNDSGGRRTGELVAGNQEEQVDGGKGKGVSPSEAKVGSMEGMKRRIKEDMRSKNHHDGPDITEVDESCHANHQERKTSEFSQERAAGTKDELVLIKIPHSKWEEEESEEEEQHEGALGVQTDAPTARVPPSSSVSVTAEVEAENKQGIGEKESNRVCSHRSVAPSSGKGGMMKMDRLTAKEKGNERESRTREDEKERNRNIEGSSSSKAALQMSNSPSSSHPYVYLTSRDTERRAGQLGDDQDSSKSSCSPGGKPLSCSGWEGSAVREQAHGDVFLDLKGKGKDHSPSYPRLDSSGDIPHRHRPTWIHHSSPSFSQSELMGEGLKDGQTEWEGWRELEEGERSSSRSKSNDSSESSGSSSSSSGEEGMMKSKEKKRRDIPELQEEGEQKKHKMSEKHGDGGEDRSSREGDDTERGERLHI